MESVRLKVPSKNINARLTVVVLFADVFQILSVPQLKFLVLVEKIWVCEIVEHKKIRVGPEAGERVPRGHRLGANEFFPRKQDPLGLGSDEGSQMRVIC